MSKASLRFVYGSMNSAKTLRLLTMAYNFDENNIPFIALKPSIDTREGDRAVIKSRVGLERECVLVTPENNIYESINKYNNILLAQFSKLEWVLIDECQFLTEEQIDQLGKIVDELDINVMCFGLRTDFMSKLFPASKRLFEIADSFEEVKARCGCGKKTSINARFDENNQLVMNGEQILVGGNELYKPICRSCWMKLIKEKRKLNSYETSN